MKKIKKRWIVITVFLLALIVPVTYIIATVPDLSVEKIIDIGQTLTLYDKDGNISATLNSGENREIIKIESIPQYVVDALIATEDIRFYSHNGIDVKRIFGALINNVGAGSYKEGASTITQQLIKNSHLTREKTVSRKINEAILALQLERRYDKNEILEMYFNFMYFGRGAYGIQAAAKAYFGIEAEDLTCAQGAMLVGILKAPSKYAPHISIEKAENRRNTVLSQMKKYGYITEDQYAEYRKEAIVIAEDVDIGDYGYFTDYVLEEGANILGISVSDFMGSGYRVYTTLDSFAQEELQNIYSNTAYFPDKESQSAAVILDNQTGGISAMIGGREHNGMRLYNRATALRQPGSCIKPILVYAPAFENGSITAVTVLDDYRKDFDGYSPSNFKDVYYGKVTVREALRRSLNVPAVEILSKNGIEYSKTYAEKAGIVFDDADNYLALSLGGMRYGTSQLQLAGAYRCFASGGNYVKPWCIDKITDADGKVLYKHKINETPVFKSSTAWIITDILCDVSKQSNNPLSNLKYPVACKTGTVGFKGIGYSDALSTSYSTKHTISVWMGYDMTDEENCLDESITGSTYPTVIAKAMFEKLFEKYGYTPFEAPDTITEKAVDVKALKAGETAVIANADTFDGEVMYEYFDISAVPEQVSYEIDIPQSVQDFSVYYNEIRKVELSFTVLEEDVSYVIYKNGAEYKRIKGKRNERIILTDEEYNSGDSYSIKAVRTVYGAVKQEKESQMSKEFVVQ